MRRTHTLLIAVAVALLSAAVASAGQQINSLDCKDDRIARSDGNGWVCSDGTLGNRGGRGVGGFG